MYGYFYRHLVKLWKCYCSNLTVKPHWFLTAEQGYFYIYLLSELKIDVFEEIKPTALFIAYIIRKELCSKFQPFIHYSILPTVFIPYLFEML